jgi:sulfur carrier protein
MKIYVNGETTETAFATLGELLRNLNYISDTVATAVDGTFVPRQQRDSIALREGISIEIVAPMQGG